MESFYASKQNIMYPQWTIMKIEILWDHERCTEWTFLKNGLNINEISALNHTPTVQLDEPGTKIDA